MAHAIYSPSLNLLEEKLQELNDRPYMQVEGFSAFNVYDANRIFVSWTDRFDCTKHIFSDNDCDLILKIRFHEYVNLKRLSIIKLPFSSAPTQVRIYKNDYKMCIYSLNAANVIPDKKISLEYDAEGHSEIILSPKMSIHTHTIILQFSTTLPEARNFGISYIGLFGHPERHYTRRVFHRNNLH